MFIARTTRQIIDAAAEAYGVHAADVLGHTRKRSAAYARHDAMRLIREKHGWSYPQIAELFQRDHTSVMFGVKSSTRREEGDQFAKERFASIKESLPHA